MSKRCLILIGFLFFFCVFVQAQSSRWAFTYPGGYNDFATDIVAAPDGGYISCVYISGSDSATLAVLKVDEAGENLLWLVYVDKNANEEIPNNIILNHDSSSYLIFGTADIAHPWVVGLDAETGEIIDNSDTWSDALEDFSNEDAQGALAGLSNIIVAGYYSIDNSINISVLGEDASSYLFTNNYPLAFEGHANVIGDIISYQDSSVLIAINDSLGEPVIWQFDDSGIFISESEMEEDSVMINTITTAGDYEFAAAGNLIDSSAIYLGLFDTTGISSLIFDTIYTAPGYKVTATDIIQLNDGSFLLTATHFSPLGLRTAIMHTDAAGNILSEEFILNEAGEIALQKFALHNTGEYPVALAGYVNTFPDDNGIDFLIIRTDTAGEYPGCIYDCIWPGDADYNGVVDMEDLLVIGVGYGLSGNDRDSISNFWQGNIFEDWADILPSGLNANYANCNGDSSINEEDTAAIILNYGLTHTFFSLREMGGDDYPIWLNTAGIILDIGYNEIPVMLGTGDIPVDDIYGLQFTIAYEGPAVIDSTTVQIQFNDSWLGDVDIQLMQLDKNFSILKRITGGVSRIDQNNTSGYGEIGRLSFVVEDNIEAINWLGGDSIIIFNILNATAITNEMEPVYLDASSYSAIIAGMDEQEMNEINLKIFPNPVSGNEIKIICNENLYNAYWKITD
ncbi:MAG: hypothetical protein H7Y00_14055, partial [Fimbriimonadaceae bacterium]|nr:hypothetical protein [Chitinophagales bacterium]